MSVKPEPPRSPSIETPEWVKDAVFYQIFPDRFAKSARVPKPNNLEAWEAPPTAQGYKGGDLLGVVEHLDYLVALGITAIYFTPIFQSASNHRYHTHDYEKVDPLLGGNAALRTLVEAAHARGIRVILDGVFNHASRGFFQFNDILENGPFSAWLDWFLIEDWPLAPYAGAVPANYVGWDENRALPKFNTENPQVREFIMQIGEFWLREYAIDGWRLDVPFEIKTEGFWEEFRQRMKAINPEAYIVGEVWRDARQWLQGDQFDAVMNYLFTEAVIAFIAGDRVKLSLVEGRSYEPYPALSAEAFADRIEWLLNLYDWEVTLVQLNLLDSHDTAHLLTIAQGDTPTVRLATLFQMTYPGAPSIYYGDEIGLPGGQDPDCRCTFPWHDRANWDLDLLEFFKGAIALRHAHPVLRRGRFSKLYGHEDIYAFARYDNSEALVVAINVAEELCEVTLPVGAFFHDGVALRPLFGQGRSGAVADGRVRVSLPAREGLVLAG
ncbi:MAG: glycoside hydrolase family 13 protein [Ardenticatenaceae bacterium]|nr:glycoside hydrolase family 13 protein [Ardenticatenaceae bacterium]HBY99240.1 alpha-amylase [Chloroflexota bacterium]